MQGKVKKHTDSDDIGVPYGFHMEIDKNGAGLSASVTCVDSITDFSADRAVLRSRKNGVVINGVDLSITVYENHTVQICGKISEVVFI